MHPRRRARLPARCPCRPCPHGWPSSAGELEDERSTFCIVALTHTSIAKSTSAEYHLKKHNAHEPLGGRSNLRGMMRDIRNLKAQLAKYRPDAEEDGLDGAWGDAE